ncbi:MAG TPA: hypothetical protein VLV50_19845, partial [Stellaceae bacterium]|nr:hypothetical protein [Stellaceae bacterium]
MDTEAAAGSNVKPRRQRGAELDKAVRAERGLGLTDAKITGARALGVRYFIGDRKVPGLFLRVGPTGSKSFTVIARNPYGKQIWAELPHHSPMHVHKLGDVRKPGSVRYVAAGALAAIARGEAPFPPPAPEPETWRAIVEGTPAHGWRQEKGETVALGTDGYIHRVVRAEGHRTSYEIERILTKYVLPEWGDKLFTSIKLRDVTALRDKVQDGVKKRAAEKPGISGQFDGIRQANHVVSIIGRVCRWYQDERDPDYVLPLPGRKQRRFAKKSERERTLDDAEIRTLWPLWEKAGTYGAICRVLLLTAQRFDVVASMKWADVSDDGVWTIPGGERRKGDIGHVKLPATVLAIIKTQPKIDGNPYVFAAGRGASHFASAPRAKRALDAEAKLSEPYVNHDLRRTARTILGKCEDTKEYGEL